MMRLVIATLLGLAVVSGCGVDGAPRPPNEVADA
jgi:hypothetical protein